jgi:hypothetical protein
MSVDSTWRCDECGNRIELLIRPSAAPVCCSGEMSMIEGPDHPISTRITPGQGGRNATLTDHPGRSVPRNEDQPLSDRTKRRHQQRINDRLASERRRRPATDIDVIVADVRAEFTDEGRFTLRTCRHCGEDFEAQRSTAQFCNATCRKAHHRKESK